MHQLGRGLGSLKPGESQVGHAIDLTVGEWSAQVATSAGEFDVESPLQFSLVDMDYQGLRELREAMVVHFDTVANKPVRARDGATRAVERLSRIRDLMELIEQVQAKTTPAVVQGDPDDFGAPNRGARLGTLLAS